MTYVQRWAWLAGALATILAAIFVAFTLRGVQDASQAAGDFGELRAYAERARAAALAGDEDRVAVLSEQRRSSMEALEPAIGDVLGRTLSREAFANVERLFGQLEEAAARGDRQALDVAAEGITVQVNLLLDLISADRDGAVDMLRRMTVAGIALTVFGTVVGLAATLLNHRRMRQLSLSEAAANQRYESLISSMQNGILVLDEAASVAYCNQAFAVMLGFNADDLVGMPSSRFVPPEHAHEFEARRRRVVAEAGVAPPRLTQCVAQDGSRVDVCVAITPILEGGRCVATLWEFRNVTREVQLRQQVSLEVAKGEGVLGIAPVPIVVIDESGIVIAANPAVETTLGWPPGELVGHPVSVLMPEPFASQHAGYIQHYLETGKATTPGGLVIGRERPAFGLHRDGRQFPIAIQVAEARMEDGQRVFTGVIYDLTRQSNLEGERLQLLEGLMQEQRDVAVGTMVGGVAHDFNNLLTAIIGAIDLEISTRGESSRWLDHAAVAARRASSVVERLIRTVRPHQHELHPLDVREVMMEMVELARETFDRRVSIQAYRPASLPLVLADPSRLGQALLNLMLNARDATLDHAKTAGPGYVPEIRVATAVTTSDDRRVVRIMVSDNGNGMPLDVQARVFDPFFTTKRDGKGSGLGLTMVRAIVREMDGELGLESDEGIGTTVTIDLPALADEVFSEEVPSPRDRHRRQVLVVDDEESIREIVSAALHRHGCDVRVAPNGEQALEALRLDDACDLVLLDLNMPGLSGWDVLARIRERRPELPVVMMSGNVYPPEAERRGASASLCKPFSVDELIALVEAQLSVGRTGG